MKLAVLLIGLLLAGCTASTVNGPGRDPNLHSEEAPFAAFCAAHPHHGTCP